MTWKSKPWFVFDTEATGVDPETDRIVQIGGLWVQDGGLVSRHLMTLNPGVDIPEGASSVHGITNERVQGAPTLGEVFSGLVDHFRRAEVVLTYNGSRFDWPLLVNEAKRLDLANHQDRSRVEHGDGVGYHEHALLAAVEDTLFVDVLVQVRRNSVGRFWKGKGRHRLSNVGQRMGITLPPGMRPHRADADCWITAQVLWATLDYLPDGAGETRELLADRQRQQEADFQRWLAKQGGGAS